MKRWTLSTRYIATREDDERWLQTIEYRINPRLSYGIEYNLRDGSANLLRFIWTLQEESGKRPMIVLSSSETRAGSVAGGHLNLTVAKSLPNSPLGAYVAMHFSVDRGVEFPFGASAQTQQGVEPDGDVGHGEMEFAAELCSTRLLANIRAAVGWGFGEVKR